MIPLIILTALLSAGLSYGLIRLNAHLRLTAVPRGDRWHRQATPNSGGVAIFLSCAAAYALGFRGIHSSVAIGAACLFLIGFLDDRIQLRPIAKFAAQCLVALFVVASGVVFPATSWHWFNLAFSFLWIIGITNAFNLIDNMDGLCAGVAVIICGFRCLALAANGYSADASLTAIVGAAFAGFLMFNYNPARIFMGDCGSMLAGFTLAALTIASPLAHTKAFAAAVFYPALTFTYPIFDTLLVSFLRKSAGRRISVGGRDHSSHRLASLGMSERKVVWLLWSLAALGSAVGLMVHWMPLEVIAAAAILIGSLTMFGIFLSTLPPYHAATHVSKLRPSLRAGVILIVDALLAGFALFMSFLIRWESVLPPIQIHNLLVSLPVVMACHALLCCLERTFDVSWQWFTLRDVLYFSRPVIFGAALSYFVLWFFGVREYPRGVMLLYCVLCVALGAGLRASLRMLQDLFGAPGAPKERVAILGANSEGEMLATLLQKHSGLNLNPVVFLDYDGPKNGMRIRGIPVRCCDLQKLSVDFDIRKLVAPAKIAVPDLERDCTEAGVLLCAIDISVRELTAVPHASGLHS